MTFTEQSYIDVDFSREVIETQELTGIQFQRCSFRGADFTSVEIMYNCKFDTCDFTDGQLNGVVAKSCAFLSCKFISTSFFATKLEECKMTGSDFRESELGMAIIIGGDFTYTLLRKQSFQKMDLSNIRFEGADLSNCHFNQCKMNDCVFDEAIP